MTRATLTKTLQAQGRTYESYRTELREAFIVRAMYQHNVPKEPTISPHKIELYYVQNRDKFKVEDQVKLRLIVLTNGPSGSLYSAKKVALEVLAKIKENGPPFGKRFSEMAGVYSQGFRVTKVANGTGRIVRSCDVNSRRRHFRLRPANSAT